VDRELEPPGVDEEGATREVERDPLHAASVGLDKWPWLRAVIATLFVVVWLACLIWDWFVRGSGVLPGWFQALGVIVLGYLLGIDLITNFFRNRGRS
jgi:hypothetical protein